MFKDNDFQGDISKDINKTVQIFGICARQCPLFLLWKSDFFIHVFVGAAPKFLPGNSTDSMSSGEKVQLMLREYASNAKKLQVKGTLEALRLRLSMGDKGLPMSQRD